MAGAFPVREAARLVMERARLLRDGPAGEAADRFADLVRATPRRPAELPIVADAYGRRLDAYEAADPAYWAAHLRTGMEAGTPAALPALPPDPGRILVEAGTGGLAEDARRHPDLAPGHLVVPALAEEAPVERSLLSAAGHLWLAGTPIAWSGVHDGARRAIVDLPTYPFQRQRHVVEPEDAETPTGPAPRSAVEGDVQQVVERLFAEVLGLDRLDPDESFFDLGGDSLIATQFLVWIRRIYPVDIVLRAMFKAPSANAFGALVRERMGESAGGHDDAD
jgi:acyl transferase domain-containing protein